MRALETEPDATGPHLGWSSMILLWVALGAAVGAPARYLTDRAVQTRRDSVFPWGTLTVNVVGSFILGVLAALGSHVSPAVSALVAVGFCGALTTFSTFGGDVLRMVEQRRPVVPRHRRRA